MEIKANLFIKESVWYILTLVLGVYAAFEGLKLSPQIQEIVLTRGTIKEVLIGLGIMVGLLFLIFKLKKVRSTGLKFFLSLLIFFGANYTLGLIPAVIVLILYFSVRRVWMHNVGMALGIAGISGQVGLEFSPLFFMILLIAMSAYDIFAVYISGHMISMARKMIESNAIFGFIVPLEWSKIGYSSQNAKEAIGEHFMLLGSGDVALPLMLVSSSIRLSLAHALIVAAFTVIGLFITHLIFVNQRERRPMAALPPIASASIIGFLIATLIL